MSGIFPGDQDTFNGAWLAHAMFDMNLWQTSTTLRDGPAQWLAEAVATAGLILVILRAPAGKGSALVASYIGAAYWFTASTSFANPAAVLGRMLSESFAGIAKAMGAEGIVVDRLEDVGAALKKAVDLQMNERKTCVIEIMCTRELGDPFRRDALAKPVRLLEKYKDYV